MPPQSSNLRVQLVSENTAAANYKSTPLFEEMKKQIEKEGPAIVKKLNGVLGFKVKGSDGTEIMWIVDAKNGSGSIELNSKKKPECTLTMKDSDLVDLMLGNLNPNTAFFSGKLKISGNMGLAMKIQTIMPAKPKL